MKTLARVVLVFIGFLFVGSALFLLAVNYRLIPGLAFALPVWVSETVLLATGAGLMLFALILLSLGLRPAKKIGTAILKSSEAGEVLISITALENMVLRVLQQIQGVKDVSRQVISSKDGLAVKIRIKVMPDVSIPAVIDELQTKTKEYLEEITGITVNEVKVMVENIITDQAVSKK